MCLRMKNVDITGVHWKKNVVFRGVYRKALYGREMPRKGGLEQFAGLRGSLGKKEGEKGCFKGFDTLMHTMFFAGVPQKLNLSILIYDQRYWLCGNFSYVIIFHFCLLPKQAL